MYCSYCGKEYDGIVLFCTNCGSKMLEDLKDLEDMVSKGAEQAGNVKFCLSCGAPMKKGHVFCAACGTRDERADAEGVEEMIQRSTGDQVFAEDILVVPTAGAAADAAAEGYASRAGADIDTLPDITLSNKTVVPDADKEVPRRGEHAPRKKKRSPLVFIIPILLIAAALIAFLCFKMFSKGDEDPEGSDVESQTVTEAPESETVTETETETETEKEYAASDLLELYNESISKYRNGGESTEYYLCDADRDGIKDLVVKTDASSGVIEVYSVKDGKVFSPGKFEVPSQAELLAVNNRMLGVFYTEDGIAAMDPDNRVYPIVFKDDKLVIDEDAAFTADAETAGRYNGSQYVDVYYAFGEDISVQVTGEDVPRYSSPYDDAEVIGRITDKGTYMLTDGKGLFDGENSVTGTRWGRLKSGLGWIKLVNDDGTATVSVAGEDNKDNSTGDKDDKDLPTDQVIDYTKDETNANTTPQSAEIKTSGKATPYLVKTYGSSSKAVPYYSGAGYNYAVAGYIREEGKFTIVEDRYDANGNLWGRLKSGVGWVCIDNANTKEYTEPSKEGTSSGRATPYLVTAQGAKEAIPYYSGPGYGYAAAGYIKEDGKFTILEDKYDSQGNLWGRLKSGVGWVRIDNSKVKPE